MSFGRRVRPAEALERALRTSSVDLLSFLRRRVGTDDAPDLLGEMLVVAWRRVEDLPSEAEDARMWLFGIARGVVMNYRRGERRRWALADRIRDHMSTGAVSPPADEHVEVHDAIARLDPDLAELVQLVHWDGMTIVEAATIVGVPASTARSRYQRAKDQLRVALGVSASSR